MHKPDKPTGLTRRQLLAAALAAGVTPWSRGLAASDRTLITRPIPADGRRLPVVGLGTSRTFDVAPAAEAMAPLQQVLEIFLQGGGELVDTSPMYGHAEEVIGVLSRSLKDPQDMFLATKVWTRGREAGIRQMQESLRLMQRQSVELMQVHNLVDTDTHMRTLRQWREQGRIQYIGVTHYRSDAFDSLAAAMRKHRPQFVQLNYSLAEREAEQYLLPLAQELGIAVIVNRPFARGRLFRQVRGKPLPTWAADFDCNTWAQFFLKFVVSHPTVTCAIPATSKPRHMRDNIQAAHGGLPDRGQRQRMADALAAL